MRRLLFVALPIALGCSSAKPSPDAGRLDAGGDGSAPDSAIAPDQAGIAGDTGESHDSDAGSNTGSDAGDADSDAGSNTGSDAGDAGSDTGSSTGSEVGEPGIARLSPSAPFVSLGTIDAATGGVATITVTNLGNISTGPLSIVPGMGLYVEGCVQPLQPGKACILTITVLPRAAGAFSSTVMVSANPGTVTRFELTVTATIVAGKDAGPAADAVAGEVAALLTPSTFVQRRAEVVCAAIGPACAIASSNCIADRMAEYQAAYEDALGKSRGFVGANAQACLDEVKDTYGKLSYGGLLAAADYQAMEAECATVYRGAGAANAPCLADADCASDLVCDKGHCGTYRLVAQGAGCSDAGESCPAGYYCSNAGASWTCAARAGLQETCATSPCLESLRCVDSFCSTRLALGQLCQSDGDCTSGFCEPYLGKCTSDIRFAIGGAACIAMGGT